MPRAKISTTIAGLLHTVMSLAWELLPKTPNFPKEEPGSPKMECFSTSHPTMRWISG